MNQESRRRLEEAARYQKKALLALVPEQMAEHLEVIEQELKAMMLDFAIELVKEHMQDNPGEAAKSTKAAVKKIEIG